MVFITDQYGPSPLNPSRFLPGMRKENKGHGQAQTTDIHCASQWEKRQGYRDVFSFGTYCLLNSAIYTISMFVITRKFSIKCKKPETSKSILSFDCFID